MNKFDPSAFKPIYTAPRDRTWVILLFPNGEVKPGFYARDWFEDEYWCEYQDRGDSMRFEEEPIGWQEIHRDLTPQEVDQFLLSIPEYEAKSKEL